MCLHSVGLFINCVMQLGGGGGRGCPFSCARALELGYSVRVGMINDHGNLLANIQHQIVTNCHFNDL